VIRVTADSNVTISVLNFGGVPRQFLLAARRRQFQLDISPPILSEVRRVLGDKFSWTEEMPRRETERVSRITTLVHPTQTIDAVPGDPDDNRILECAVAAQAGFIVSGDNHLLRLNVYHGIRILKVADFMQLIPAL
jgi:putative PIN family toxin of toxin-antitoxin system